MKTNNSVSRLFDEGTFVETGARITRPGAPNRCEAVICGYGAINGKLAYAFVEDSGRSKGAFDATAAEKICALYRMAIKNGAPVIGVFDSVGAVVEDGSRVLSAYGKVMNAVTEASGYIPQIALVEGVCSGMSAVIASMFDVCVAVKDASQLYLGATSNKKETSAEAAFNEGNVTILCDNADKSAEAVKKLIDMLPSVAGDDCADECRDDISRAVSVVGKDAKSAIEEIADKKSVVELYAGYAANAVSALCRIGGQTSAVVYVKGTIDVQTADKVSETVSLADRFGFPIVTLIDSDGVSPNADRFTARALGSAASAYADASCAKVTVITGRAYGAAFTTLGSLALGADMVYALEGAVISPMTPESAVAFLWNDKITTVVTRADLEKKWKTECASADNAAANGDIDDIIPEEELRARICSAIFMLAEKEDI